MSRHLDSRRLRRSLGIALPLAALILAFGSPLPAQDRQDIDPGIAPNTRRRDVDPNTAPNTRVGQQDSDVNPGLGNRVGRASLPRPDMVMDPVDPEIDRLLQAWSDHTEQIKNLAGKHYRATRDYAYGVETLAEGRFFLEMPDKGRIDVGTYTARSPKAGDTKKYVAPDGKSVQLTVKTDGKREKWICDGKTIRVIDDIRKSVEEVPIPPKQQGANMMDGPLPFLLGMPPDKAKARYRFQKLGMVEGDRIWIEVKPKHELDAAEWTRAHILLNLTTYLPERVSLFNPAGTTETVYLFFDIEMNKGGLLQKLFTGDPFKPNTWGYKREVHAVADRAVPMPVLVGATKDQAIKFRERYRTLGFDVKFERGSSAPSPDQIYSIQSQEPAPNTPLKPGQKIILHWYDKTQDVLRQ